MKKNTFVTMWYVSLVMLSIALLFFVLCFLDYWYAYYYIPFSVFLLAFTILFGLSYKNLRCENGYTLIQASAYYRVCILNGYKEGFSNSNKKILEIVAEHMDILADSETTDKMTFCNEGKKLVESMKNPTILFIWKIQDRYNKNIIKKGKSS